MTQKNLREASGAVATAEKGGNGTLRLRVRIIEGDVQGSSGYYPAAVIERDGPKAFPRGTHMHLDHMDFWELASGSPGKLETLAGIIDSTPVYETVNGTSGLYADCLVISKHATFIEEVKDFIGVSILAACKSEPGISPTTGEETDIVTDILGSLSVDFVTHPGANGRIISVLESAPNLWPEGLSAAHPTKRPAIEQGSTTREKKPMADITEETAKSLAEGITALTAVLTAAETARAAAESKKNEDDAVKIDPAAIALDMTTKLTESGLPAAAREKVVNAVKAGVPISDAIAAEASYIEAIQATVKESSKVRQFGEFFVPETPKAEADDNGWMSNYGIGAAVLKGI